MLKYTRFILLSFMTNDADIIIIGAGPVGIFTAFQAGILGMKSCIIDVLNIPGGQCSMLYPEKYIYDIPGYFKITAQNLIKNLVKQAQQFKPSYHLGDIAKKINFENNKIIITTEKGSVIAAKALIIAAGCGAFDYNKIPISGIETYEKTSLHYMVSDLSIFKNKNIAIAGGGDSSADWAITLSEIAKKIYLIHRRGNLRCVQSSSEKINEISKTGKIELIIPFQIENIIGDGVNIQAVEAISIDKNKKVILNVEHLLAFFGIKTNILYIKDWGIKMENNNILVNHETAATNLKNVYAVGDVSIYPGKLKLILTGFAESAKACHDIYRVIFPDKAFNFEYSTNKEEIFG